MQVSMTRTFLCLAGLVLTTTVQAQALPPPPRSAPQQRPLEEASTSPSARALFHVGGGFGFLTQRDTTSGYRQLANVGYDRPWTSWHLNAGAQLVATDWLRVGAELSYEFTGDTTERNVRGQVRSDSTRFHMGLIDLSLTPYFLVGRAQLGLRVAGGFGFSRWLQNDLGSASGMYRASIAFDVYLPLARRSTNGVNIRVGYQLRRTLATGPIDLVFDQSAFFANFAFMFGAGS